MSASGAFAMGPAAGPSSTGSRPAATGSRAGMRRVDTSQPAAQAASSRTVTPAAWVGSSTTESTNIWDGALSDASDDDEWGRGEGEGKQPVMDLHDIGLEHEMAPMTLPWDPRRVRDKARVRAKKDAQRKLEAKKEEAKASATAGVKMETDEPISLASGSSTPAPPGYETPLEEKKDVVKAVLPGEEEIKPKPEEDKDLVKVGDSFLRAEVRFTPHAWLQPLTRVLADCSTHEFATLPSDLSIPSQVSDLFRPLKRPCSCRPHLRRTIKPDERGRQARRQAQGLARRGDSGQEREEGRRLGRMGQGRCEEGKPRGAGRRGRRGRG